MTTEIGHPIKVAARRSGLTPHVIRVWEKRYNAVSPARTASNRRLYTDADIERLRILRHLRIADEHLAAAVVRSFIDSLRAGFPASLSSPHIVVTTPAGQLHEIGALVVSAQAAREGWRVTYLGSSLPAQEIARAAHQNRARAVALSLVYPEDDPHLGGELVKLRRCLSADTTLLVGGWAAGRHRELLEHIGATYLPNLSALGPSLAELRTQSTPNILHP